MYGDGDGASCSVDGTDDDDDDDNDDVQHDVKDGEVQSPPPQRNHRGREQRGGGKGGVGPASYMNV